MASVEAAYGFTRLRTAVLDRVRFVEHDQVERQRRELVAIAGDEWVGRDHDIVVAELGASFVAIGAVIHGYPQRRGEAGKLALPVADEAGQRHDHRGSIETALFLFDQD